MAPSRAARSNNECTGRGPRIARRSAALGTLPIDGHLNERFDEHQWERIFGVLEGMPPGKRSLRQAIMQVDPSFED